MDIKNFKLKYSNRAIMIHEQITGTAFKISNVTEQYVFFYSVLLANNPDTFKLTFNEFIDWLDEDNVLKTLVEWLQKELLLKGQLNSDDKKKVANL